MAKFGEWTFVKDEVPEVYRDKYGELIPFLVCEVGTKYPFRALYDGKKWGDGWHEVFPVCWMPFPEPYKKEHSISTKTMEGQQ